MYFKNRISDNINRRKLVVDKIVRNTTNNEIKEMFVNVTRDDINVIEEGTPLSAEVLNAKFDVIYESLSFLFKKYFSTDNLTDNWIQQVSYNYKNFFINLEDTVPFYAKVHIPHVYLTSNIVRTSNPISIMIYETKALHDTTGSFTRNLDFYVELYSDVECTKFVTRLKGLIKYTNTSTDPLD